MHKWRPPSAPAADDWKIVHQNVVPKNCRRYLLELAHSTHMAGHLGVKRHTDECKSFSVGQVSKRMYNSSVNPAMCSSWLENQIRKCQ